MGSRSRGQWPIPKTRQKTSKGKKGWLRPRDNWRQLQAPKFQAAMPNCSFYHSFWSSASIIPSLTYGCLLYCLRKSIGYQPQIFDHIFMIWLACNLIGSVFLHKLLPENNNWQITNCPTHWCIYWLIEWCTKQRDLIHPSKN